MKKTLTLLLATLLALATHAQPVEGQRVIYEMNVGAFTSAGTLKAAEAQLGNLHDLGIDIVWLMPIYPRGGGVNSPYAATDFQQVNPSYGTVADLRSFVAKAHTLDMQVWLDWVPNHMATNATWVTTHPEYFAQQDGQMVHPNNYGDVYQLNYQNSDLVNAMNDCLKYWIDQADIDGYRCDYISSPAIPTSYWQSTIPMIKGYKSGKTITFLGEADLSDVTRLQGAGFDYDYAWGYQETSLQNNFGAGGTSASVVKSHTDNFIAKSEQMGCGRMVYLTNHDKNFNDGGRTLTQMYGGNRYPLTVLQFTIYGMPLVYNGQEVGGNQILDYFADTKIDWGTPDKKMENTIRSLCSLKHEAEALHDGKTTADNGSVTWLTVTNSQEVLAYKRTRGDSEVLVVLNFGNSAVDATVLGATAGEYALWLDSKRVASGVTRKSVNLNTTNTFSLDTKGYAVYVKGHYDEIGGDETASYTPTLDSEGEISIFLETPTEGTYNVWAWDNDDHGGEYYSEAGQWPGDAMTLMGQTAGGNYIYKYVQTKTTDVPNWLIITRYDGSTEAKRLWDGTGFINHGYYVEGTTYSESVQPAIISTTTAISLIRGEGQGARGKGTSVYTLQGQRVGDSLQGLPAGIYIEGGRKIAVR